MQGIEGKARLEQVNIYSNYYNGNLFDYRSYTTKCTVKPRTPDRIYSAQEVIKERPNWNFAMSIFRDYKIDTEVDRYFIYNKKR